MVCNANPNFNSHAHVERDAPDVQSKFYDSNFNSHAHVERDVNVVNMLNNRQHFNSHAHVERDLYNRCRNGYSIQFQLTRSRGA